MVTFAAIQVCTTAATTASFTLLLLLTHVVLLSRTNSELVLCAVIAALAVLVYALCGPAHICTHA
jgi:hypothetical protein